jgi:SAM-dependent methyltransferase
MAVLYQQLREHEQRMAAQLGQPIRGLRLLEIGPGQGMQRARYFGLSNEVVGLDLDVIPQGLDVPDYYRMLRRNGLGRLLKTVGRKLVVGQAQTRAWHQAIGVTRTTPPRMINGDICQRGPERAAFDVVMSWSVFEHLPDPRAALRNVIQALRPGGIFYLSLHLFTSHNGHHDIRAFTGREDDLPLWGHLRPARRHLLRPSAYLNEWRLSQWRQLFQSEAPGSREFLEPPAQSSPYAAQLHGDLRAELRDYSDEELLTVDAIYVWRRPLA